MLAAPLEIFAPLRLCVKSKKHTKAGDLMRLATFFVTLTAEILAAILTVVSIASPRRRIWPPREPRSTGDNPMRLLFLASAGGVVILGLLGWGEWRLSPGIRWGAGLPLWAAGNALNLWALSTLGKGESFGDEGPLVVRGPYRFSRNPQYVGMMVALIGWGLMASSPFAMIAAVVGVLPLVLVPFAEEPWLAARHGAAYEAYVRTVPRYLGRRKTS